MSTETHVNVVIQEIEEAYKDAMTAIGTLKEKADALKARLLSDATQLEEAVETGRPPANQAAQDIEDAKPAQSRKPAAAAAEKP